MDTALRVATELKRFGKVKRPWLGIIAITNSPVLARVNGLPERQGAVVADLYQDSPAFLAGIRPRDIIYSINGKPIRSEDDFKDVERKLRIGDHVRIDVQRYDQTGSSTVTVGEAP
jgi:S1-C subfamily serine protease